MITITTSKGEELTPEQIASMSEVIAEYMDKEIITLGYMTKHFYTSFKLIIYINELPSWDWLHEVCEKFMVQNFVHTNDNIVEMKWHRIAIETGIINNDKELTFKNLFNAIQFINQLKQTNGKESI